MYGMDNIKVAKQFKFQRIESGLTQGDLAELAFVTRLNVIDLEAGKNVGFHIVAKIMTALNLELAKASSRTKQSSTIKKRVRNSKIDGTLFPQLKTMLWDRSDKKLTEKEAFQIYERNGKFLDRNSITQSEDMFLQKLIKKYGNGVML